MNCLLGLFLFVSIHCCATGFKEFYIDLLRNTIQETGDHVVISPFGVWTLLTGLTFGATGKSYDQLIETLVLPRDLSSLATSYKNLSRTVLSPTSAAVKVTSNNFMFYDQGFTVYDVFKESLLDFDTVIQSLKFKDSKEAAVRANNIIKDSGATVSDVLKSNDFMESRMILTNVISFKGFWNLPFNQSETTVKPFYDEYNNEIGSVNMMSGKMALPFSNIRSLKAQALEMAYGYDGKYSMLFLLPYPNINVVDVYQKFEKMSITDIYKQLQSDIDMYDLEEVDVLIPRFRITTEVLLNNPLIKMGVSDIFDKGMASFGRMTDAGVYVSAIVHKADIEVTESGTTAYAATKALITARIGSPAFVANRPFIYFVMEKSTSTVLFSGIYSKPSVF